jgi:hypothetical protein
MRYHGIRLDKLNETKKPLVGNTSVPVEVRNTHLPNANHKNYRLRQLTRS